MRFFMPTRLYCEKDCVRNHAKEIAALGTHALIVTGKSSSKKNHSLDDVISVLDTNDTSYTIYEGVEENPSVETVMDATKTGIGSGADMVIGIGGGSALDAAKAVALMMRNPQKGWEFLYEETDADAYPVIAVPTTCGTGSEVTGVSVLTRHDLKTKISMKHKVFPKLALVDGRYLLSAPKKLIINTSIDALAHLIESAINIKADYYSLVNAIGGISLWKSTRPFIDEMDEHAGELDEDAALMLMEVSAIAGIAIAQTGTSIPHALSYPLTYEAKIPHGPAVGRFLCGFLEYADSIRKKEILDAAGFESAKSLGEFINRLAPADADTELVKRAVNGLLSNEAKLKTCPYHIDEEKLSLIAGL